jgi:hypothetical protein
MPMSTERCTNCVGELRDNCDLTRADVARKVVMLMGAIDLCHGFGEPLPPACVTQAANELSRAGCATPVHRLIEDLNQPAAS